MEIIDNTIVIDTFLTVTLGILVLFFGKRLNAAIGFLNRFSIPTPVSGGLLISILITLIYALSGFEIEFSMAARDTLLVYFFTTIGINASLSDLLKGGKPLIILLAITLCYMVVQNLTGVTVAQAVGLSGPEGLLGGTVSLIGGHGTAIAWAPKIADGYGVTNAMEMGIACATFGLILASLMGGPIAHHLVKKHNLQCDNQDEINVGVPSEDLQVKQFDYMDLLDAVLAIHICILLGYFVDEGFQAIGLDLPFFVSCLFSGILLTNAVPKKLPRITGTEWPAGKPAIAMVADMSLGTFLAMSLMSMQLWTLLDLAGPIFAILTAQFVIAVLVNLYILFPAMGKNYDAAVICAGFGGISLGSTPTAMANMSAVTQKYGASHLAFIIVPLVCAFFIDLANALLIPFFLNAVTGG
ncbi:sodium/glutamate symporter [Rubritalea tangerina]|uniref:Sodium/glutamate symporter n=1 Tax=Rubritalea tangerina TaxID=430798 RepID=A0ABW4ZBY0_9BACT